MKKMYLIVLCSCVLLSCRTRKAVVNSQKTYIQNLKKFQQDLNAEFKNPKESPLDSIDLKNFKTLAFFQIDPSYRIKAHLVKNKNPQVFEMATSTQRKPKYTKYGDVYFKIHDTICHLEIYQNQALLKDPKYKDYLFAPFGDRTNGNSTYAGGRYLDLRLPKQPNYIILDFNKAYNPYCAYSHRYSCPLIPYTNILPVYIKAGVKRFHETKSIH